MADAQQRGHRPRDKRPKWGDQRVVIIASGGLTHFVVNESFDHTVLAAMQTGDARALTSLPEEMFQSGTSEIKNWITVAGAMAREELTISGWVYDIGKGEVRISEDGGRVFHPVRLEGETA